MLENEYGYADVDQQLLKQEDGADVWDLTEGCICCTKSADLNASVMTIESTLRPEYLVIEPSGVGALSNIIHNLRKIEYEHIKLLDPVTIIDADHFTENSRAYADIYMDQLSSAGTVVISKPNHPDAELLSQVKDAVGKINPKADVLQCHYTKMPEEWWEEILHTSYNGEGLNETDKAPLELETFTLENCRAASPVSLLCVLEQAVRGRFGSIVRAKGILPAGKDWVSFDIVSGAITITGIGEAPAGIRSECVWIGRAIDRVRLRKCLADSLEW